MEAIRERIVEIEGQIDRVVRTIAKECRSRPQRNSRTRDGGEKQAIKAKRECFEDCQEILLGIKNLEDRIKDGQSLVEDKKDFKGSFAEKYARK